MNPRFLFGLLFSSSLLMASNIVCKPSVAPDGGNDGSSPNLVEAGITTVNGVCSLLEGITQNQTIISICATADEIAQIIVPYILTLNHRMQIDAGVCTVIPTTSICATKEEIGKSIALVLKKREMLLLKDGGVK